MYSIARILLSMFKERLMQDTFVLLMEVPVLLQSLLDY